MKPQIEKQLVGRLKIIGWFLIVCAVGALIYRYIPQDEFDVIEEEVSMEVKEAPPLNPFFVSAVFGLVGTSCFFISWKKKKGFLTPDE